MALLVEVQLREVPVVPCRPRQVSKRLEVPRMIATGKGAVVCRGTGAGLLQKNAAFQVVMPGLPLPHSLHPLVPMQFQEPSPAQSHSPVRGSK